MIYPSTTGRADGNEIRLRTLEIIWIQGKLRMWGRWSHIGGGACGNMFNQLLASNKITKTAIKEAMRRLKRSGVKQAELEEFFREMMVAQQKSNLAFCTDSEALLIDKVVGETLADHPGLIDILHRRYKGRGMSKRKIAEELNEAHPEWCLRTCESRVDVWLSIAEAILYAPMCEAFGRSLERFAS